MRGDSVRHSRILADVVDKFQGVFVTQGSVLPSHSGCQYNRKAVVLRQAIMAWLCLISGTVLLIAEYEALSFRRFQASICLAEGPIIE